MLIFDPHLGLVFGLPPLAICKRFAVSFPSTRQRPEDDTYRRGIESRLLLPEHVLELRNWSGVLKTWSQDTYHGKREGDDGVTVGVRDTAGSDTIGVIG